MLGQIDYRCTFPSTRRKALAESGKACPLNKVRSTRERQAAVVRRRKELPYHVSSSFCLFSVSCSNRWVRLLAEDYPNGDDMHQRTQDVCTSA